MFRRSGWTANDATGRPRCLSRRPGRRTSAAMYSGTTYLIKDRSKMPQNGGIFARVEHGSCKGHQPQPFSCQACDTPLCGSPGQEHLSLIRSSDGTPQPGESVIASKPRRQPPVRRICHCLEVQTVWPLFRDIFTNIDRYMPHAACREISFGSDPLALGRQENSC